MGTELAFKISYLACMAFGFFFFLTAKRRADGFSVAFASAAIYFLPGLIGETSIPDDYLDIHQLCYLTMSLVLGGLLVAAIIFDFRAAQFGTYCTSPHYEQNRSVKSSYAITATILQLFGFAGALKLSGTALLAHNKHEMAETFTQFHLLWLMGAPTAFIISVHSRRYGLALLNFLSLLGILFIGSRNQLAIGVIGAVTILLSRRGFDPLIKQKKTCIAIILFVCFVFLYKVCYIQIKMGDMEGARSRLNEKWVDAFLQSEPSAIQHILNVVITEDYHMSFIESMKNCAIATLSSSVGSKQAAFGDIATYEIFGDLGWGMASNIWAEMYAYGGMVGIGIFVLVYINVIQVCQSPRRNELSQVFFASFMPWWCFYIHRNDVYRMVSFSKQLTVFLLIMLACNSLIRMVCSISQMTNPREGAPETPPRSSRLAVG